MFSILLIFQSFLALVISSTQRRWEVMSVTECSKTRSVFRRNWTSRAHSSFVLRWCKDSLFVKGPNRSQGDKFHPWYSWETLDFQVTGCKSENIHMEIVGKICSVSVSFTRRPLGHGLTPCFSHTHWDVAAPSWDLDRDSHYKKSTDLGMEKFIFPFAS